MLPVLVSATLLRHSPSLHPFLCFHFLDLVQGCGLELAEPEHLLSWDKGSELVVSEIEAVELPSEVWAASGVPFKCQQ